MKNLLIISTLFLMTFQLHAQSASGLMRSIESIEEDIAEQKQKNEEQKQKVKKAEQDVEVEIKKGEEDAKENPKDHGVNKKLQAERDTLKAEQDQLKKEEKALEKLEAKFKKAKDKLDEKLNKAVESMLKRNPIPDKEEDLDDYEGKMKKLETQPRNSKVEEELRKRIQKRIDAKRKQLEEQGALPGSQNSGTEHHPRKINHSPPRGTASGWTTGAYAESWFAKDKVYDDFYIDVISVSFYSNEERFAKLSEILEGEFFIGSFSAPGSFSNHQYTPSKFIGINSSYRWSNQFVGEIGIAKGQSTLTAAFPMTVIDFEKGETRSMTGQLTSEQNYYSSYLHAQQAFFQGWIKAVLGAGINYQYRPSYELQAIIADQKYIIDSKAAQSTFFPRVTVGLEMHVHPKLFLEAKMATRRVEEQMEFGAKLGIKYLLASRK